MSMISTLRERLIQTPAWIKVADSYASLAPRERRALSILAWVLLPLLTVFLLIVPATKYLQSGVGDYRGALEDMRWIEANRGAAASGQASGREPGQSLFGLANSTSKGFQISFKRYEPVGDNALSLWMENVNFNSVILWLERLDKRHGIEVKEISVEQLQAAGLVNVRLVLQG